MPGCKLILLVFWATSWDFLAAHFLTQDYVSDVGLETGDERANIEITIDVFVGTPQLEGGDTLVKELEDEAGDTLVEQLEDEAGVKVTQLTNPIPARPPSPSCIYNCEEKGSCSSTYVGMDRPGRKRGTCYSKKNTKGVCHTKTNSEDVWLCSTRALCEGIPRECKKCTEVLSCPI